MKNKIIISSILCIFFSLIINFSVVLASDAINNYNNYVYPKAAYKEGVEPPYAKNNIGNEDVNLATGNLDYKVTDLFLKGKNGLDFSLTRYYSLTAANIYEPYVKGYMKTTYRVRGWRTWTKSYVNPDNYNQVINVVVEYDGPYYAYSEYNTYEEALIACIEFESYSGVSGPHVDEGGTYFHVRDWYNFVVDGPFTNYVTENDTVFASNINQRYMYFGTGWAIDLPIVEKRGEYDYLHFGSAGVWRISFEYIYPQRLVNYDLKDMKYDYDYSFNNGQWNSHSVLIEKSGKKTFFDSSGRVIGIQDRFGNNIKFQYVNQYVNNHDDYKIQKIIDSVGREINITHTYDNIIININDPTTSGNNKTITYTKFLQQGVGRILRSVTDAQNQTVSYEYEDKSVKCNFLSKDLHNSPVYNTFACLTKVKYPTNGETHFDYSKHIKNLGNDGLMEFFKVKERYEWKNNNVKYNYKAYNYRHGNTGEYDGYPAYYTEADIPDSYTFKTQVIDLLNNTEVHTYNKKMLCTNTLKEGLHHKIETINEYEMPRKLLIKTTSKTYNKTTGQHIQRIENKAYDTEGFRNLIAAWSTLAEGNTANTEYKTSYTYNSMYHYVTSKTYKKD